MFDSAQAQEIRDHVGGPEITADDRRDPEGAVDVLWSQWTDLTAHLQDFGVAPNAFCTAANQVAEARNEIREREGSRSR